MKDVGEAIEKYDLDMEMLNSSEAPMLAEAKKKMNKKEPVVFYGWRPHSMFQELDIKILEHERTPDLFPTANINVVANEGLKKKADEVYKFLSNWSIPIGDVESMIAKIDNGENPENVAQDWIDNNQEKVDKMKEK